MKTESSGDPLKVIHKFRIVKHGLDKDEVYDFIAKLIEKNAEYAEKLQHVDSLRRLAERTLIEANRMAEQMKAETVLKAGEDAATILVGAEERAKLEAQIILAKAEKDYKEKVKEAEELTKRTMEQATVDAEQIKVKAGDEANRIVAEASVKLEELEKTIRASAEIEARGVVAKALQDAEVTRKNAEDEALLIKRKAEDLLSGARHTISEMKKRFKEIIVLFGEGEESVDG